MVRNYAIRKKSHPYISSICQNCDYLNIKIKTFLNFR